MAEASTAAELIDALVAGGEPVDEGSFSFDTTGASAKLLGFQYLDRSAYLVPIAEAAAGLDARRVSLETRGADLLITLEGVHLRDPAEFLASPFRQLRTKGDADFRSNRALARLGVGLSMALGHASIHRIAVSYSTDQGMLVAEYRRDAAPRLARNYPEDSATLRILVDRPWSDRLARESPLRSELDQLRAAVRHSQIRFEIDGEVVSKFSRRWEFVSQGEGEGYRYEAGIEPFDDSASIIELRSEDVCVDTIPGSSIAFRAVVHLDDARRDISQMKVIHDDVVTAALAAVEAARGEALLALSEQDALWSGSPERPLKWREARVDRIIGRPERAPPPPPAPVDGPVATFILRLGGAAIGLGGYAFAVRMGQLFVESLLRLKIWQTFCAFVMYILMALFCSTVLAGVVDNERAHVPIVLVLFGIACGLSVYLAVT